MSVKNKRVNDNTKNDAKDKTLLSSGKKFLKGAFGVTVAAVGIGAYNEWRKGKSLDVDNTEDGFSVGYKDNEPTADSPEGDTTHADFTVNERMIKNAEARRGFSIQAVDVQAASENEQEDANTLDLDY